MLDISIWREAAGICARRSRPSCRRTWQKRRHNSGATEKLAALCYADGVSGDYSQHRTGQYFVQIGQSAGTEETSLLAHGQIIIDCEMRTSVKVL